MRKTRTPSFVKHKVTAVTLRKKFYCGTASIGTCDWDWGKETQAQAIRAAQDILEDEPDRRAVYIVQVIGVVERPPCAVTYKAVR